MLILFALLAGCLENNTVSGTGLVTATQGEDIMKAENGNKVIVEYKGTLQNGEVFDQGELPEFELGKGQMIAGFEKAILGMSEGEEKTVTMKAEEAYGEVQEELIIEVEKDKMPNADELQQGMQVQASNGAIGIITEITETTIKIDFNHPLAGKDLTFWIKVKKINKE